MKFRFQSWLALASLALIAAGGGAIGCGSSTTGSGGGGGSGSNPCFDYSSFKGSTPATTFRKDVLPIFRRSCGLSDSCHGPDSTGNINLPSNQPYLGPAIGDKDPSDADIKMLLAGIVNQAAHIPTSNGSIVAEPDGLKIVAPNHPETSFMMSKIDAVFDGTKEPTSTFCSKLKCATAKDCGDSMPQGGPDLEDADKTTIRLWIAQGAQDN